MTWFLNLFRAYRDLEAQLADSAARSIQADDDVRFWRARCQWAEERADKSIDAEAKCAKTTANFVALQLGQEIVPFPDVYTPVPRKEEPVMEQQPRRRQAREVADELDREFKEAYGKMIDQEIGRG